MRMSLECQPCILHQMSAGYVAPGAQSGLLL